MQKKTKNILLASIAAFVVVAMASVYLGQNSEDLQAQVAGDVNPSIDLSNVVVMGDSISAGYHLGMHALPQFGTPAAENYMTYVMLNAGESYPQPIIEQECANPANGCTHPIGVIRLNPMDEVHNLAVPGAALDDVLNTQANVYCMLGLAPCGPGQPGITEFILGFPEVVKAMMIPGYVPSNFSQLELAETLAPSTVVIWIGNNDVLGYATGGGEHGPSTLTPVAEFEAKYNELMSRAKALDPSAVIVMNIPDITSIPHFFTFDELAVLFGVPANEAYGLTAGQVVAMGLGFNYEDNVLLTLSGLASDAPTPTVGDVTFASTFSKLALQDPNPLLPQYYLDATEIAAIEAQTEAFNNIIEESTGNDHRVKMIDVNEFFSEISEEGVAIGKDYTATAQYGDLLFDLDGVHPSPLGHAVMANKVIKLLNDHYSDVNIPEIDLYDFAMANNYVLTPPLGDKIPGHSKVQETVDMLTHAE